MDVKHLVQYLAGGTFSIRAAVGKIPFPGKLRAIPCGVTEGCRCECDGKGGERAELRTEVAPRPLRAQLAQPGAESLPAGREPCGPLVAPGTRTAVWTPSMRAMASAARGSGPWSPFLLQLAALLGTLGPQVRSGRTRSLQGRGRGPRRLGRGGTTAGASSSPGSGSPQGGPWPEKNS